MTFKEIKKKYDEKMVGGMSGKAKIRYQQACRLCEEFFAERPLETMGKAKWLELQTLLDGEFHPVAASQIKGWLDAMLVTSGLEPIGWVRKSKIGWHLQREKTQEAKTEKERLGELYRTREPLPDFIVELAREEERLFMENQQKEAKQDDI